MAEREKVLLLILEVVEEINAVLPEEEQILAMEQAPIFGIEAGLDSLCLLDLILGVEAKLRETIGLVPNLAEILVGSESGRSPATLGALATFIAEIEASP
jgi:acyl carrier protein